MAPRFLSKDQRKQSGAPEPQGAWPRGEREPEFRRLRLSEEEAREAQAREAQAREAQAREAQAREAQAREAQARGAQAREARTSPATAREEQSGAPDQLTRRYGERGDTGTEESGRFGRSYGRGESGAGLGYGREYAAGDWPQSGEAGTGRAYRQMGGSGWQGSGENYYHDDVNRALVDRDRERPSSPYGGEPRSRFGGGGHYGMGGHQYSMGGQHGGDLHGAQERYPGRYRGRAPKGYQRSDERLREEICERLTDAPDIDPSDVEIQCNEGIVTLEGTVESRRVKRRIEDIVDDCYGVKDIDNRLRVAGR
ncbi:MAG TPA: BON domain-containing protein [Ferrovibrio sp.]|uniref:BON domain-containing protein n=1 Tax=Ferrovibrio sp. TaxID=1917215 RepID=UPI002ED21D83